MGLHVDSYRLHILSESRYPAAECISGHSVFVPSLHCCLSATALPPVLLWLEMFSSFSVILATPGPLHFHVSFKNWLFSFSKKPHGI
jgi:hypothetical protein